MKKFTRKIMTTIAAFALVVVLGVCLTACGGDKSSPANEWDAYQDRLEDAGYEVRVVSDKASLDRMGGNMEWMLGANNDDSQVYVVKYDSEEIAKAQETEAKTNGGMVAVCDGQILIYGDKKASVEVAYGKEIAEETKQPEIAETTMEEYQARLEAYFGEERIFVAQTKEDVAEALKQMEMDLTDVEWLMNGVNEDEAVIIIKFSSADKAEAGKPILSASIKGDDESESESFVVVCDGNVLFGGNQSAIDIAQGK